MTAVHSFQDIIAHRYATKVFDGKHLPEEKLQQLLELIRMAPSSLNLQPWKIIIVTDQKLKEELKAHAWNQEQVTSCSHLLVFCADTDLQAKENELRALIGESEHTKAYLDMVHGFIAGLPQEQILPWTQRQLYLALGNALNGAKSLGFDSCPMEGFDAKAYADLLKLPSHLVPTALCPIGYAADKPRAKARFTLAQITQRV